MEDKASQSAGTGKKKANISNPLVSIITPVLNGVKYLKPCLESVLAQSYPNIEHIFADGGSTDGTVEMLASYQAKYPEKIRFISEPDKGVGEGWNKGLRMAKGEIFGWLGADDMSEPDAIPTVVEFFKANPDAYFVYGDCNYINEEGEIIGRSQTHDFDLQEMINDTNCIPAPSAFYKREVVEKVGWFDPKGWDFDYWIRAGKIFPIHRIDKVLSSFRNRKDSISGSAENRKRLLRVGCIISRQHGGSIFSGYCRRYYRFLIIEALRPILGFTYPWIKKIIRI